MPVRRATPSLCEALALFAFDGHQQNAGGQGQARVEDFRSVVAQVDRVPDDRFPRLVEKLEKHPWHVVRNKDGKAVVIMPGLSGAADNEGLPTPADFTAVRNNPKGRYIETPRVYFAEAYTLIRHAKYPEAYAKFGEEINDHWFKLDYADAQRNFWQMPYFAWAAAMAGHAVELTAKLSETPQEGRDFYWYLAEAFAAAGGNDDNAALADLNAALNRRHFAINEPILTDYQFAEACEALYEWRKAKPYRDLALDWAKKYEVIQPMFAWPYAMEAKFTDSEKDRIRALGFALFLDPDARMISGFDEAERTRAGKWFAGHNPFVLHPGPGAGQTM